MRISIRRCLSILRNTSDGNELAVPATNALQRVYTVSWLRMRWCAEDLGLTLRWRSELALGLVGLRPPPRFALTRYSFNTVGCFLWILELT